MLVKGFFSISCGYFDKGIGAILAISVEGHPGNVSKERFCEIILKSHIWPMRRCRLMSILF